MNIGRYRLFNSLEDYNFKYLKTPEKQQKLILK